MRSDWKREFLLDCSFDPVAHQLVYIELQLVLFQVGKAAFVAGYLGTNNWQQSWSGIEEISKVPIRRA